MPHLFPALPLGPRQIGAVAFGLAVAAGVGIYLHFRKTPDPDEIERLRRLFLAEQGRITDATLIDTTLSQQPSGARPDPDLPPPSVLQYQYRVGGVGYESAQDVSELKDHVRHLRVDLPVQVRYDPHNPGNSIVVAESWSGLRFDSELEQASPVRSREAYPGAV